MGGALELFSCDEAGPAQVALRAFPANNTLAFFAVGPKSFHQVGCDLYTNTVGINARKGGAGCNEISHVLFSVEHANLDFENL